jgi:hypothetical protein
LKWLDNFLYGHKGFIAGGCFKNIFNKEPVKDIDVFFRSEIDFLSARKYFENHTDDYYLYYENSKVIAFKKKGFYENKDITIELIRTVYGTPQEILNGFDFTITKFAYYKEEVQDETPFDQPTPFDETKTHIEIKILHNDSFFEHLHVKRLVVDDKLPFPISSFERMLRYAKYGYFPCKETKLKMLQAIRETPSDNGLSNSLYDGLD